MVTVFSCIETEVSCTETVPLAVESSDVTPNTVDLDAVDALGEFDEPDEPQPAITILVIAAHIMRRVRMYFLISKAPFFEFGPVYLSGTGAAEHLKIKKPDASISKDISATRLSHGDPVGFPPHPRGWFSIVVYLSVM
jgi:hypothetical protein